MAYDFRKRVYGLGEFFRDFLLLGRNSLDLIASLCRRQVGKALHAKLNMAVIGVLGCKYCSWLHSELALANGVEDKELQELLSQELGAFSEEEAVALAFAQHYSETGGRPSKEAEQRLQEYYGPDMAKHILLYLQVIYFGNLSGNTVDAFIQRLKGRPVDSSTLPGELVIFLIMGPYYLMILPLIAWGIHKKQEITGR